MERVDVRDMAATPLRSKHKVALFLPSLGGGGAERVFLHLAQGFVELGCEVDLVLAKAAGPYLPQVPHCVRVVDLGASRVLNSMPGLARYLRRRCPLALLSALDHANAVAVCAQQLTRVSTRVIATVHLPPTQVVKNANTLRAKLLPVWARIFYRWAHAVVAVSQGVAKELIDCVGAPERKVKVIYNPVITPNLFQKADEQVSHPWFREGEPPVVIGVGRLTRQKDFPTLVHAFGLVRRQHAARLIILGEGEDREFLEDLARRLGLADDVALPGFVQNPYSYMRRAAVFVLSSQWEGLPTVLVEALAVGVPVVSTDCPSGPQEILEGGRLGKLVPIRDPEKMALAIAEVLKNPPRIDATTVHERFGMIPVTKAYLQLMDIEV